MAFSVFSWPVAASKSTTVPNQTSEAGTGTAQSTGVARTTVTDDFGTKVPKATATADSLSPQLAVEVSGSNAGRASANTQRTTHVQVTRTITMDLLPTVAAADISHPHFDGIDVKNNIAVPVPVLGANGAYVKKADFAAGLSHSTPPSQASNTNPPPSRAALAGGIIGGIFGLVLLLVLIRWFQKRTACPDVELARGHQGRSTDEILNAVAKRAAARKERTIEPEHGGFYNVELAQADGWRDDFATDNFQSTLVRGGGEFPGLRYPTHMPMHDRVFVSVPGPDRHVKRSISPRSSNDLQPYVNNRHNLVTLPGSSSSKGFRF